MHAERMDHSDGADTGADNSVTSRMELCIITNLEFNMSDSANAETSEDGKHYTLARDPRVCLAFHGDVLKKTMI